MLKETTYGLLDGNKEAIIIYNWRQLFDFRTDGITILGYFKANKEMHEIICVSSSALKNSKECVKEGLHFLGCSNYHEKKVEFALANISNQKVDMHWLEESESTVAMLTEKNTRLNKNYSDLLDELASEQVKSKTLTDLWHCSMKQLIQYEQEINSMKKANAELEEEVYNLEQYIDQINEAPESEDDDVIQIHIMIGSQ